MKVNNFTIFTSLSLLSSAVARPDRYRAQGDVDSPVPQNSRVTAFVNTDKELKVECWAIGDFLPENVAKDGVRATTLGNVEITLFSFAPSATIFSFGTSAVANHPIDFRSRPNLFTVKEGLVFVEAKTDSDGDKGDNPYQRYVFAGQNGDDWFYIEDRTSEKAENCEKTDLAHRLSVIAVSGSDTNLINFAYQKTPRHKVLHPGRCNFAGLTPSGDSQRESDSRGFRVQVQEL